MQFFLWFATCVGVASIATTLILAIAAFCTWFGETYPSKRSVEASYEQGKLDMRKYLSQDAYWFSEDETTMLLLQDLADLRIEDARARWRERRKGGAK